MDNLATLARWLVIIGVSIAVLGGLLWLASRIPGIERLPGTIKIEGSGFTCVIPLLASIVLSILLTLALNLLARFLNK